MGNDCSVTKEVLEDLFDKEENRRYQRNVTVLLFLLLFVSILTPILLLYLAE